MSVHTGAACDCRPTVSGVGARGGGAEGVQREAAVLDAEPERTAVAGRLFCEEQWDESRVILIPSPS